MILDGKAIAAEVRDDLKITIAKLADRGIRPKLVMLLVGEDGASEGYVRSKSRMALSLQLDAVVITLPTAVSEDEILGKIDELNHAEDVDAILVQLPLPNTIDEDRILSAIRPDKDVDGFHPANIGKYAFGHPVVWPCTALGIVEILDRRNIEIEGKVAVVIGRSKLVGWPTAQLLLQRNATVIQCHRATSNLSALTRQADILVSAAGQARLIGKDDVKPGSTIIDVAMNYVDGKLVGDVDFDAVQHHVSAITPVPGGVGPLTVTMLMYNTVHLASMRRG